MKKIALFACFVFVLSCKKEPKCDSCTVTIFNGEPGFSYSVTFTGVNQQKFTLQSGSTKQIEIPSETSVTIKGDLMTPYAHNDYQKTIKCDMTCSGILVTMKQ